MKKSHITRILSAAIKYRRICFIPAGTTFKRGSKNYLNDKQVIVTANNVIINSRPRCVISVMTHEVHFGDYLLDTKDQGTTDKIKKALNRAARAA